MQKERSVLEVYPHFVLLPENAIILLSFPFIKCFAEQGRQVVIYSCKHLLNWKVPKRNDSGMAASEARICELKLGGQTKF